MVLKSKVDPVSSVHRSGKRKHEETDNKSVIPETWVDTLTLNLNMCREGMEFESKVISHLKDVIFLTAANAKGKLPSSFFQFEEAVFKLAATPKCSDGVFVYAVFEFENHYYIKYFEPGIYAGFMEQTCIYDILDMLKTKPEFVFLSKVATQVKYQ